MRCPVCNNHVLQKSGSRTKLRTHGPIEFEDGVCHTQCYWCKAPVEIPMEIKSGTQLPSEKFFVRRKS